MILVYLTKTFYLMILADNFLPQSIFKDALLPQSVFLFIFAKQFISFLFTC